MIDKEKNTEVCDFVIEVQGRFGWEPLYSVTNLGVVFTNKDTRNRRIVNKTMKKWAILPPGTHESKNLTWKNSR